jgi:flagellar motor component MotA
MTWYEILIAVIIGLILGGLVSYVLFYPLYEALRDFEDAYTKECKAIIECYNKINEVQKTISETLKIQEDTNNKIINVLKNE